MLSTVQCCEKAGQGESRWDRCLLADIPLFRREGNPAEPPSLATATPKACFFLVPWFRERGLVTQQWIMGQGNSRSERLTKEDVIFLKANTNYDEETIQVIFWSDPTDFTVWQFPGMVQGFHLGLPQRKTQPCSLCQDLQPVLPKWECEGLLRPHLQDLWHGWQRLHRLQRVSSCNWHHFKWNSRGEVGLGIQVRTHRIGTESLNWYIYMDLKTLSSLGLLIWSKKRYYKKLLIASDHY